MGAYNDLDQAIAGLKVGVGMSRSNLTVKAMERIDFGSPVFGYEGDELSGYNVKQDVSTITLDADLVSLNVITTTITIDGVVQDAVATTFDTSHDDTMDQHKADLEAAFDGLVVTLPDVATNRQFTLTYNGVNMSAVASVVTLGATQATVTIAYNNNQVFLGVALFTQLGNVDSVGFYQKYDAMNILTIGHIWVNAAAAVNAHTDAYVIWSGLSADQKKFTGTSTNNYATGCKFKKTISAAGLTLIEVRGEYTDATP